MFIASALKHVNGCVRTARTLLLISFIRGCGKLQRHCGRLAVPRKLLMLRLDR